ncbi:MAG: PTS glucose transporter subunit IIA [Candidatus Paralactobacillus gallistercoris]|uniref:PTS glucose transporter subunit IIA n=1 Tax=Candidatus Paralactobacillus gallistercoris TaxID=2838724 RepID=A0A948TJ55_9LACO|nr:PTS glucose transporter subunit IIA [Candidatus Paralactobacillus gallistercoris]
MFEWLRDHKKELHDDQVYAPADGILKNIMAASDPVFAARAMGTGFIVKPANNQVYAPVSGIVSMITDTKHAISIKMANGLEVLVHMGINTVTLKGTPFVIDVKVGDFVKGGQVLAQMNLTAIAASGLDNTIIIAITNTDTNLEKLTLTKTGDVHAGEVIGNVIAK